MSVPVAVGRVLPTLNEDGSRRWIRPKPAHGWYARARRIVAYTLMVVFVLILVTATIGPIMTQRYAPLMLASSRSTERDKAA